MGFGGGGQQSTTSTQYMPEDQQLRRLGIDYLHQAGGLGGRFNQESPAASLDPWAANVRNSYFSNLTNNMPMRGADWQTMASNAANFNPFMGAASSAPQAQGLQGDPRSGVPQANWLFADPMTMRPQAQGLAQDPMGMMPSASGGGMNFMNPNAVPGWQGNIAFDPGQALGAAQNAMQRVIAPQIANNAVAGGSNPMSGAYAEAIANAGSQMALPIMQQISQQQYGAAMPQIQGFTNAQLQQQGAQQGLQSQGYGGAIQGLLGQQGAQNQFTGQQLDTSLQGLLAQQNAQNQYQGQGYGTGLQGMLAQQGAQNQLLGQGFGAQLQGGLNQQQNVFNQAMQTPAALNQLLQGQQSNFGQQLGLASMDQNQRQQEFLRQQALWQQAVSGMYGSGGMQPISQTTNTSGGGGGAMQGALQGGLGGAAVGSAFGPLGAAIGGGAGLLFGGLCWIADALYGEGSEEAKAARAWVSEGWQGKEADEFRQWYWEHGRDVATALALSPAFAERHGPIYRRVFREFVENGREYLKRGKGLKKRVRTDISATVG